MRPPTVGVLRAESEHRLRAAGVADPVADTSALIALTLIGDREGVHPAEDHPVTADRAASLRRVVGRRADRVPLAHLTGVITFDGLTLLARPGVFLPRAESQVVIPAVLTGLDPTSGGTVVDLACGSGAITCAVASRRPRARVIGIDISAPAVSLARANAERLGLSTVAFGHADATAPGTLSALSGQVDVIVANPPYIPPDGVPREVEVARHEVRTALYGGGPDGLEILTGLLPTAHRLLRPGGLLVLQHADVQGARVRELVTAGGFADVRQHTDVAGSDRFVTAVRVPGLVTGVDVEESIR